jgi:hypothetical protein
MWSVDCVQVPPAPGVSLNTTPQPKLPTPQFMAPQAAVPNRFPEASIRRVPLGFHPSLPPVKRYKIVSVHKRETQNTNRKREGSKKSKLFFPGHRSSPVGFVDQSVAGRRIAPPRLNLGLAAVQFAGSFAGVMTGFRKTYIYQFVGPARAGPVFAHR